MVLQLVLQLICIQISYDNRVVSRAWSKVRYLFPLIVQKAYIFQAFNMWKMLVKLGYYLEICIKNGNWAFSVEGTKPDDYLFGFDLLKIIVPIYLHIRNTLNSVYPIPKLKRLKYLLRNSFILIQRWQLVNNQRWRIPTCDEHLLTPIQRDNTHRVDQILLHVNLSLLTDFLHRMHCYLPLWFRR